MPQHFQGACVVSSLNVWPVIREPKTFAPVSQPFGRQGDEDRANRLFLRASAGSRDSGCGQGKDRVRLLRAPSAIARATSSLTAPWPNEARIDAQHSLLGLVRIGNVSREENSGGAGTFVIRWARNPPVQDSATASVCFLSGQEFHHYLFEASPSLEKIDAPSPAAISLPL